MHLGAEDQVGTSSHYGVIQRPKVTEAQLQLQRRARIAGSTLAPSYAGRAVGIENQLQDEAKWDKAVGQQAHQSSGGTGYAYSLGGGGGGSSGGGGRSYGGGGGGAAAPDTHALQAYMTMLDQYNHGAYGKPFDVQLLQATMNRDSAAKQNAQIEAQLKQQLGAIGPSPYAHLQPAAVSSANAAGGGLTSYLQAMGIGSQGLQALIGERGQQDAQDAAHQRAMYQMLNASDQAAGQSRTAEQAYINSGALHELGDQFNAQTSQISQQKALAQQAAMQQLIQFALQNKMAPNGLK